MSGEHEGAERYSIGHLNSTKPPTYFLRIAHLISKLYPNAKKIVEVGVGRSPYALLQLKSLLQEAEIIAVDIDPGAVGELNQMGVKSVVDDISEPNMGVYEGADLIYSIRPPFELISKLAKLGKEVGANVLVIPLSENGYLSDLSEWDRIVDDGLIAFLLRRDSR